MTHSYILNGQGDPVPEPDTLRWAEWFEHSANQRRVAFTQVEEGIKVSTVFLGLDHSFVGGPPVLWETMIFGGNHDQDMWRYTSKADALLGHEQAVRIARGEVEDDDAL